MRLAKRALGILLLVWIVMMVGGALAEDWTQRGIVSDNVPFGSANLYTGPGEDTDIVGQVPRGAEVSIRRMEGNWYWVVYYSQAGYARAQDIIVIPVPAPTATYRPTPMPTPWPTQQPVNSYAKVNNPNPNEKLNLRAQPVMGSAVLGSYSNGTMVRVLDYGTVWCQVEVDGNYGYMMTAYLYFGTGPVPTAVPMPTSSVVTYATVKNPVASQRLNLRERPDINSAVLGRYYNGTTVKVYERGSTWCYVQVNSVYGYMMTAYLSFSGSSSSYATVKNPVATQVLNLREGASSTSRSLGQYYNGTRVRVISYGTTWCNVEVNGVYGYMMTRYLSFDGGTSQAVVKNPLATQVLNLRETASSTSRSLGQYYNGTRVTILEYGTTWCRVEVNGLRGYMMTKYLQMV